MRGFTLLELLLVLFVLGVVLGSSMVLAGRFDPGPVGLRASTSAFFESSRDRARASGRPVVVEIESAPDDPGRLRRLVYRPVREASFEPDSERRHGLEPSDGGVSIGEAAGRFGGAASIDGGSILVGGRGGQVHVGDGFGIELQLRSPLERAATLISWPELLRLTIGADGAIRARVELVEGSSISLSAPAGSVRPDRWHHLALAAADGSCELRVDSELVASDVYETALGQPEGAPLLGNTDGTFTGLVDEFALWNRIVEHGPELREEARLVLVTPRVRFGPDGYLDPAHGVGVRVELWRLDELIESFLIGRFSEQEVGG